jgi:transposase
MAKSYRPVDRDQVFLLPPSMREWLPAGHPVWLVIEAVALMDTSAFHAGRKTGGAGAAGYDPDMLLAVLVWAYAHRVTSSRRMERLCQSDVAFRVICGGNLPDHVTFARFRAGFADAAGVFFAEVLVLCARLGMGQLGVVALDGMKIAASASKAANRGEEKLRELAAQAVAAHGEADAAEDALFGAGVRGDEPGGGDDDGGGGGWSPRRRAGRIAAALADLEAGRAAGQAAQAAKAGRFRARQAAGQRTGRAPAGSAVVLAQENLARVRAAREAELARLAGRYAAGQPRRGRRAGVDDYCRVRAARAKVAAAQAAAAQREAAQQNAAGSPGPVRNITDPDSRLMPVRGGGFLQGYNTQNVPSADGLIIATELTSDTTDMEWLEPMLGQAQAAAALITAHHPAAGPGHGSKDPGPGIGLLLADAGYCSEANLTCPGPDRLIATSKHRDLEKAARSPGSDPAGPGGPALQAMRQRLRTHDGMTAYRQRGHIAETPHGNIKHNMGFRQLSMRGKPKATAEWTFVTTVHNLFKAITTGHLTPHALTHLASQPATRNT